MQIEPEFRWINKDDCGKPLKISGYNHKEKMLYLISGSDLIQMNVYGKNFNFIYNTFGNETDKWIGKDIKVRQDLIAGKNIRTVTL